MQIDFHHAATYVVSRLAGLPAPAATIVAHAAQYVDDATNAGRVLFTNGAMYGRIASAHKMLDYRNYDALADHEVWVPFHFLPGNEGLPEGEGHTLRVIDRLICRPNSFVAREVVRMTIADAQRPEALHRLGIAMHTYVDTWAHQGFAGTLHDINNASDIHGPDGVLDQGLLDKIKRWAIQGTTPLGHGPVLSNPDLPYLKWSYVDGRGSRVHRDNPADFLEAAQHMCIAIQRFIARDPSAQCAGLPQRDSEKIDHLLRTVRGGADERHAQWLTAIASGVFSFGPEQVSYIAKGVGSWKHTALGAEGEVDEDDDEWDLKPEFMTSDWKRFHDALQRHRLVVLLDVLPRFGIVAG